MRQGYKILFGGVMWMALAAGFLRPLAPDVHWERLHIFLLNLCAGGTLLLFFTQGEKRPSKLVLAFGLLSFGYALLASLEYYTPALLLSLLLAGISEKIRWQRFGPWGKKVLDSEAPMAERFHAAALLFLSLSLLLLAFVLFNHAWLHLPLWEKLELNLLFLAFSFPLSLWSFSLFFSFASKLPQTFSRLSFAGIIGGVCLLFLFILYESPFLELLIALWLTLLVLMLSGARLWVNPKEPWKNFLTSGMGLLILSALTGVAYILKLMNPELPLPSLEAIRQWHRSIALYGWNLVGLVILLRFAHFPSWLNSTPSITLHWILVLGLIPLSYTLPPLAPLSLLLFAFWLYNALATKEGLQGKQG